MHTNTLSRTFLITNQAHCLSKFIQIYSVINSTCFGQLLCPSSEGSYCTFGIGEFHGGSDDRFQGESGYKVRQCPTGKGNISI